MPVSSETSAYFKKNFSAYFFLGEAPSQAPTRHPLSCYSAWRQLVSRHLS